MVARRAEMAFSSSEDRTTDGSEGMSRFRTDVVVGVAPTERTRGCDREMECTAEAVTRRDSNSWRSKSRAEAGELEE